MVVLVAIDGEIAYERAAGMIDREASRPMPHDAIFRLASVTKPIVAAAAMSLIEKNAIALDDPVTRWIPEFKPQLPDGRCPRIRIWHLLTHTSGLSYAFQTRCGPYQDADVGTGLDLPGLSLEGALQRLASVPLLFEPGTRWYYSMSIDVLGAVLARASGEPLPDIIRHLITKPLSMNDTDFVVRDSGRLAVPYVDGMPRPARMNDPHALPNATGMVRFSPSRVFHPLSYPSGGAGMVGTAHDFLTLLECLRSGGSPILSALSTQSLTTDALGTLDIGEPGWGFGFAGAVLREPQVARTPHDLGTWRWAGAYGHQWFVNPKRSLSVVSFTNTALEGVDGAYAINLRDAIYYALSAGC